MRGLLPLFCRLSLSAHNRTPRTCAVRSISSATPSRAPPFGTTSPCALPPLPTGQVLSNARTKAARDARAEQAVGWFLQGWLPSEIARGLRPDRPYSIHTVRIYLIQHARDSIVFRTTVQHDRFTPASSPQTGEVQLNRLRLLSEGSFLDLALSSEMWRDGMSIKDISLALRRTKQFRFDTIRTYVLTGALVDPDLRKLVEADLAALVSQGRSSRYRSCTTFEQVCEVMKNYFCTLKYMNTFNDVTVERYKLGLTIGMRIRKRSKEIEAPRDSRRVLDSTG